MVEIYWLQRLGNIGFCFNLGLCICIIIAIVIAVVCFSEWLFMDDDCEEPRYKHLIPWFKKFAMVFAFFTIGSIIIPTQNDLMVIYGLGGTIDYIKSNDKAKELPDKVVNALTRYIDYVEKEKTN